MASRTSTKIHGGDRLIAVRRRQRHRLSERYKRADGYDAWILAGRWFPRQNFECFLAGSEKHTCHSKHSLFSLNSNPRHRAVLCHLEGKLLVLASEALISPSSSTYP